MLKWIGRACGLGCAAMVAAGLAACGGGGGGSASTTLTVARTSLAFEAEQGDATAPQVISGTLTNATDPITVTISYTSSGILSANFTATSDTAGDLTVTPRAAAELAPGTYNDTISVSACFDPQCTRQAAGSPRQVAVTYTVKRAAPPAALQASERGIAFAVVPGGQRTAHSVVVTEPLGIAIGWTATSSAPWLSATPAGAVGGRLALAADAAALPEGFHLATVTLRASGATSVKDETLRVGLYKSSATPAAALAEPLAAAPFVPGSPLAVTDPVRPLAYIAYGETIAAQHFHTGARAGTVTLPGETVRAIVADDDGRTLYVLHMPTFGLQLPTVTRIDLGAFQVTGTLVPSGWRSGATRMAFARVGGRPLLVFNTGSDSAGFNLLTPIADADTGALAGRIVGYNGWDFTHFVSAQGGVVFAADRGITGGGLSTTRLQLRANSKGNIYNTVVQSAAANVGSSLQDLAVRPDGALAFLAYFGSNTFLAATFDGTALTQVPGGPPNTSFSVGDVEFLADGRYVAVTGDTLRLYSSLGSVLFEWTAPPFNQGTVINGPADSIRVSADGLRLLGNGQFLSLPN